MLIVLLITNTDSMVAYANTHTVTAKSYVVMDKNGKILINKNMDERREVASICKLMTTLITLEQIQKGNISLEDKFVASEYACSAEGSQAFLDSNQEYYVKDLLKSVIVASANDSAIVLAENIAGSEGEFVSLMNKKASELGMTNTKYANSTGLSYEGSEQYSTCKDTAIILNEVSEYDIYRTDCQIWMDTLTHPSGRETELVNTNRLIKYYPYCQTGKTGFTDEAGYCLSSTSLKDNLKLTCVVLGCNSSANRFTDSVYLYNSAYASFASEKVCEKGVKIDNSIKIKSGKLDKIDIMYADDCFITLSKKDRESYTIEYDMADTFEAPIEVGDKVGVARVIIDGKEVGQVDIVSNTKVDKQNYKDIVNKIIDKIAIIN